MKKVLLLTLLLSSSVYADVITLDSAKCSLFGKVKVQVDGLEAYGKIGTTTFKSEKYGKKGCKNIVSKLKSMFQNDLTEATVDFNEYTVERTEVIDRDRDHKGGTQYVCKTTRVKKMTFVFDSYRAVKFNNRMENTIATRYGRCN